MAPPRIFSADAMHVVLDAANDGRRRIDHSTNHGRRRLRARSSACLPACLAGWASPLFRIAPSRQCFVRFETLEFLSHLSRAALAAAAAV